MSLLPIVQRELRATARRKSTFRIRWWTALLAMGACFVVLGVVWLTRSRASYGNPVFTLLTGYAFGLATLAGVLFTADALSQEKREGTLGLLFLSNLNGYDVVLGKFLATSLNAFYGLLALLPVTGIPLMLGGVTGAEFCRMALALLNALFFSLAVGLGISAFTLDEHKARGVTLALLLSFAGGLPALAEICRSAAYAPSWLSLRRFSPLYPYLYANDLQYLANAKDFWSTLLASHSLAWLFLVGASLGLPRLWRQKTLRKSAPVRAVEALVAQRFPWVKQLAATDRLLQNPVAWRLSSELGFPLGAWVVVGACALPYLGGVFFPRVVHLDFASQIVLTLLFGFLLKALFAVQACRFFAEGRRTGSLEFLLCTPLTDREITSGQVAALWGNFRWPLVSFALLMFVPAVVEVMAALVTGNLSQALAPLPAAAFNIVYCACMALDLAAVCWLGMWLALSLRKPRFAPALTIFLVLVVPSFLFCLSALADVLFIAWGMGKLQQDLRWRLAQQFHPPLGRGPGLPV